MHPQNFLCKWKYNLVQSLWKIALINIIVCKILCIYTEEGSDWVVKCWTLSPKAKSVF